ncbi:MAG: hypothetical protein ACJZ2K_05630, partial [Candidatus Poseidoniaceae archaeon]
ESRLAEQQSEFDELKSQDNRAEKRQSWLQAISGQGTQAESPQMGLDPSALGARPNALGASAGRPMRGAMAQAAAQHTPSMGLAGMRAPRSTAKSLSGAQPIARPVKAPIGGTNLPPQGANLPQPIMPKIVRKPVIQPVVQSPDVIAPNVEPIAEKLVRAPIITPPSIAIEPSTTVIPVDEQLEIEDIKPETVIEEIATEPVSEEVTTEIESMDDALDEALDAAMEDEMNQIQETVMLTPIKTLKVAEVNKTAVLKPVTVKVLTPVKRRGPPPSSKPGVKPEADGNKETTASLKPVTKLTPVSSPNTTLNITSEEEDD